MFNFNECKNATSVKNKAREILFNDMYEFFCDKYGADNVTIVNNAEISVCVGYKTLKDGTEGEVCGNVKPVIKEFDDKVTASGKEVKAYERITEGEIYEVKKTEKEKAAEEKARVKAEKIERDKKARAEKKKEKAE